MREPRSRRARAIATLAPVLATAVLTPLVGAVLLLASPSPAAAHDTLLGTEPAASAALDAPPTQVQLTFSADQLAVGAVVEVTGAGAAWGDGTPVVAGSVVTQALLPGMPAGEYTVTWRSVSGDGHPVEGAYTFTVAGVADAAAAAVSAEPSTTPAASGATDEATSGRSPEQTDGQTAVPSAEPSSSPATDTPDVDLPRSDAGGWLVAGITVLAVGAVAAVVRIRRTASR